MMFSYLFASGHNSKFVYYLRGVLRELLPACVFRRRLERARAAGITPAERERISYYCKPERVVLPDSAPRLRELKFPRKGSAYWFDARELIRCFDPDLRWMHQFGDVTTVPPAPTIVKSRPIAGDNSNSVLLPLNKIRHFVFANDKIPFAQKKDAAVFRGVVKGRGKRRTLFEKHFGNPLCHLGDTTRHPVDSPEWRAPKMTIAGQLEYKFVFAIEGNDVASNLKWIMSSNSLAVTPPPEFETWFMEGALVPDVHYVAVAPDYSDLDEKLRYYMNNTAAAERVIANANKHAAMFRDTEHERRMALLVLDKYFAEKEHSEF